MCVRFPGCHRTVESVQGWEKVGPASWGWVEMNFLNAEESQRLTQPHFICQSCPIKCPAPSPRKGVLRLHTTLKASRLPREAPEMAHSCSHLSFLTLKRKPAHLLWKPQSCIKGKYFTWIKLSWIPMANAIPFLPTIFCLLSGHPSQTHQVKMTEHTRFCYLFCLL